MDLSAFVDQLRHQLLVTAATGGPEARAVADQLSASLDATTRMVLLEALAAAAAEITSELAPGSVDLRLRGRDPEFVVSTPDLEPSPERRHDDVTADRTPAADSDEGAAARITLRLSEHLKHRVEEAAGRSGVSVNAWLVREITNAVEAAASSQRPPARRVASGGEHVTGWVH